jgi:hypothetical protein
MKDFNNNLAYVVGVAIGDGNLSNPNGRAVRLRVSCDNKYPKIIERIKKAVQQLLPTNKISIVNHFNRGGTWCDISCYSNKLEDFLGWKAKEGSKYKQRVSVPVWIRTNKKYTISCLRGLFETDGCIYTDRVYKMATFVTIIPGLAYDVVQMIKDIGFQPRKYTIKTKTKTRYNIRISKDVDLFIKTIKLKKN